MHIYINAVNRDAYGQPRCKCHPPYSVLQPQCASTERKKKLTMILNPGDSVSTLFSNPTVQIGEGVTEGGFNME